MKLQQLQEARYTGEHPIVKEIKTSMAGRGFDFHVQIKDKKKAEEAERGILAAFGPPDESSPATADVFRNMLWYLKDEKTDLHLQLVDGMPSDKKKVVRRKGQPHDIKPIPTMMDIALI